MKRRKLIFLGLMLSGLILSSCGHKQEPAKPVEPTYLTVSEAVALANQVGTEGTSEKQYVTGTVKSISNPTYGEMYITDGVKDLYVYGVYSSDGTTKYSDLTTKPYTNDEVFLYGFVKTYNGNPEMGQSWLMKMVSHQNDVDVHDYESMNINNARGAANNSKVLVQGVVATITYSNGKVPSGVYLVDDTSSIYVYSPEIAGRVEVGEEVKVAGTKTEYILESELGFAQTFGYQGSIQLDEAIFVSSLGKNKDFLKSWIQETTMKNIMDTPLTNNITTLIHKVTAIVNKVPGTGFVNYYINDLDNKTGSYVYTLCNGSDFNYLDAYDGKICTVYVAVHNAKSTNSGIFYRLMPIKVEENTSFSMTDEQKAQFALDYYASKQFLAEYSSDPSLELLTSISNEYIPFSDVTVAYTSNSELVTFNEENDKLVMHIANGVAQVNVTMTATYNGVTANKVISFKVIDSVLPETESIADVIDEEDGTSVCVKGIVMSSLVNQTGFYINDGTGVIAVRTTKEEMEGIAIGNEVVMEGSRKHIVRSGSSNVGQSCIDNATCVANLFGNHPYDKSTFITNKTFDEIVTSEKNKQATEDLTCNVYVAKCHLRKSGSQYSTNYYLSNAAHDKEFSLYAGSGTQYSAFDAFSDDREITVEFMLVDWNTKSEYRACIVSASDGTTTILNTLNFQ
jgi:hypothetical protein